MADLSQLTGVERTKEYRDRLEGVLKFFESLPERTKKSGSDRCGSVNERSQRKND